MRHFSRIIRNRMADQALSGNLEMESEQGRTVSVERPWTRDDEDEWSVACQWIGDQYQRLRAILANYDDQGADRYTSA